MCFLDGDDVWDSRMLEKLVAAIGENGGYDIVCCDYKRICKTYEAPRREMRTSDMQGLDFLVASLYHAISVTVWGRLYRRALFEKELRHYPLRLGEDSLLNIQIGCQQPRVRFIDYVGYGYVQRGGSANRSPLDIGYCVKFSEAVRAELVRHRDILGDRLEFYLLLNKMRWYLVYLRKSHNPWAGGTEFARGINAEAGRYRAELGGFFSRCDRLLLRMDRRRWMRPGVLAVSTLMRWGKSLKRRLAH
ncbi:MAG: glycosyltransferase family 2 protein [Alistipes sp.]